MVRTGGKPWLADRCVLAYRAKQRTYGVWSCSRTQADWEEYRLACRIAQHVYVEAERAFKKRRKALLTNALKPRKCWSTVKPAIFGASSSLPLLVDSGGRLVLSAEEKATLFSVHFDATQCRNSFQQWHSCDPCPVLRSVSFWSNFERSLLLDLDPYGRNINDPDRMFPLVYKIGCNS